MALYCYRYEKKEDKKFLNFQFFFGLAVGIFLLMTSFITIGFFQGKAQAVLLSPISSSAILGESTISNDLKLSPTLLPSPTISPSPTIVNYLTPSPTISNGPPSLPSRDLYTVAIIGDSMVDTMGEVLEYLDHSLKQKYPHTRFLLYNYGKGSENVEMGLNRFGSHLTYQDRNYPSLPELKPDILIVASFAYNPFTPYDRDRHWLGLTKLVEQAKNLTSNVYLLAEIAPLRSDFGKGPNGVNWDSQTAYTHSGHIIEQLENVVGLAKTFNIPLIDAFHPSLQSSGQEGKREYVNPGDGIHPNVAGHTFMAEKIARSINLK
jgi:hypothetical protein